jgi:hypothetical protein
VMQNWSGFYKFWASIKIDQPPGHQPQSFFLVIMVPWWSFFILFK